MFFEGKAMQPEIFKAAVRLLLPRAVRNSLRSPSKLAEWLWDSARFSLGTTRTLDVLPNWLMVCHPQAYRAAYEAQFTDPAQREEFLGFASHCSERMFLFDIGAHFGIFSLTAAHYGGRAIAVDPSPTATRMIEIQAAINGLTSQVRVIRGAVSDASGVIEMLTSGVFSYGYFKAARGRSKRDLTRVKTVTIDHMVREFGVPTHVKVDVEGHELPVLHGARATLSKCSPILFLELHNEMLASEGRDGSLVLDELDHFGYGTFSVDGKLLGRGAILERPITRIVAKPRIARDPVVRPRPSDQLL